MGIFNRKNEIDTNITFDDSPAGKRKYNVLLDVVNSIAETKPELALKLSENIPQSPSLIRMRGWAYSELEDLENCLSTFKQGWLVGDVSCGVYLHRLYRELNLDPAEFLKLDRELNPYFESRDISFLYAQIRLAIRKKDFSAAFNNILAITFEEGKATVDKYGATFYSIFTYFMEDMTLSLVPNIEKMTEDDLEKTWEEICNFFDTGIRTAEGNPLGWHPIMYFNQVADYLFREIAEGNYGSASALFEFNEFYESLIAQFDPPIPPRTFTKDEIWDCLLKALEQGNLHAIYSARAFAKENKYPTSQLKIYEDEFKSWNFEKYL